jgi:hypothetical protein
MEISFFHAGRRQVGTAAADRFFGLIIGAPELTGGTDIDAAAALPANLGFYIEWGSDCPSLTPSLESDSFGHHLFLAHPDASPAQDAVLVFLAKPLLPYAMLGGQVLDDFRLRT